MPRSKKRTRTATASDDDSDDAQDVVPAVLQRARRSTAGKRMSTLVGQAQEDDETFWSHPVWSEGGSTRTRGGGEAANNRNLKRRRRENENGSDASSDDDADDSLSEGEASYRISDEDSEAAVDQFDSDFDETESEDENEDDGDFGGKAGGDGLGQEERELRAEERREANAKRKKNQKFGTYSGMAKSLAGQASTASAGRQLMKRKEGNRSKRGTVTKRGVLGTGWNEGLVLNWPSHEDTSTSILKQPANDTLAVDSSHSTIAKPVSEELDVMASTMASCKSTTLNYSVTQHNIKIPINSAKTILSQQSLQTSPTHSNGANSPTAQSSLQSQDEPTPLPPLDSKLPTIGTNAIPPTKRHPPQLPQQHKPNQNLTPPTRKRSLRAGTVSKTKATANSVAQSTKLTQIRQAAYHDKKKSQSSKNKRHFTQEELIMEAIQKTEIENAKWLFARKKRKEEVAQLDNHTAGGGKKSKAASGGSSDASVTPVCRFYSRRGYHNILTFMDMDHLPDIFTRRNASHVEAVRPQEHHGIESGSTRQSLTQNQPLSTESNKKNIDKSPFQSGKTDTTCIITGKVAKYRDPKTQLGYHDIDAFRELRRRLEAGELPGFETWRNAPSQQSQKQPILPTQPSADNHEIQPRNGHGNGHNLKFVQHSDSFCFEPTRERQQVDQQHRTQQQIIDAGSTNGMHDTPPSKEMKTEKNDNSTMKQGYATLN